MAELEDEDLTTYESIHVDSVPSPSTKLPRHLSYYSDDPLSNLALECWSPLESDGEDDDLWGPIMREAVAAA